MGIFHSKSSSKQKDKSIKIVLVGLENAGKTSLLKLMQMNDFRGETVPTIGFNIGEVKVGNKKGMIFDVGGKSKGLWKHYITEANIVIFMIDGADPNRNLELKEAILNLAHIIDKRSVLIFLLNKIDLMNPLSTSQFIEEFKIDKLFFNDLFIHQISVVKRKGFEPFVKKLGQFMKQMTLTDP